MAVRRARFTLAPLVARFHVADRAKRSVLLGARQPRVPNDLAQHELLQQQKLVPSNNLVFSIIKC